MKTPLIEGLKKYLSENNTRFHMPGHKGKNSLLEWSKIIPEIDVTEVEGTDNLHNPQTIILESQELAAQTFGAKRTLFSVNGTTGGIYGAIAAVTQPGDRVLVQRNCHRSVYNALIFNKLNSEYIFPKFCTNNSITTGILPENVEEKLKKHSDIKAVIITNPSYYGICSNIKEIARIVHSYNKILIVDEAHGSHFPFSKNLPISAIEAGADISIQSTHKTLPAFTQASMIHVGSDRIDIDRLQELVSMYQTTSPSYLLMASLDLARAYMEKEGEERLNRLVSHIKRATAYLKELRGVRILDSEKINGSYFYDFDTTKILFNIEGLRGNTLDNILRKRYNIQLEMSDFYYGVALCTVLDDNEDIGRLAYAIEDISKSEFRKSTCSTIDTNIMHIEPDIRMSLHSAFYKDKRLIELSESKGKVSGGFIIPYPPGIPILCPGEKITEEIIEYIKFLISNNIQLLGYLNNNKEQIAII